MRPVVTQNHKNNFKSATFVTKLCTCRGETWLDSAKQCAEAWKLKARCWFWHVSEGSHFSNSCCR